jgi:hypothetical protein
MHGILLMAAMLAQLASFPGAQGGGTLTKGGRGGQLIAISNLNASGPGSYSACIQASVPRTCVCEVAGIIPVPSDVVAGKPFLTIDGATCPGGGIILGDGKTTKGRALVIETNDVIVRHLTFNPNNPNIPTGPDTGTVGLEIEGGATNVVLDHVSCFFAGNKCIITYTSNGKPITNVTQQWNMFTLPNVGHPVGPMTDTNCCAYQNVNQDFHHNFFAWIGHRIALYNTNIGHWVNNFTWNWSDPAAKYGFAMEPQGPSQVDMIGNVWKMGNMNAGNTDNPHPVNINATGSSDCTSQCWNGATQPSHYMSGNVCDQGSDWQCAAQVTSEGGPEKGPVPTSWQRKTALSPQPNPIVADPVSGLETKILLTVGNAQGVSCSGTLYLRRNSVDAMVVGAWPNGNGTLFAQQIPMPVPVPGADCQRDPANSIPVAYEQKYGIPTGASPWTVGKSGYSIFEEYTFGSGTAPPPNPPCFNTTNCPIGSSVAIITGPANVRNAPSGTGQAMGTQPTGATGIVQSNPTNPGTSFAWVLVQFNGAPNCTLPTPTFSASCGYVGNDNLTPSGTPPPHPTVTCTPPSVQTGGTSICTANQPITTWSATAGTITAAGTFTAPATAQTVTVTGTNANGAGSVPVTVTAAPPPGGVLNLSLSCPYTIVNGLVVINSTGCKVTQN